MASANSSLCTKDNITNQEIFNIFNNRKDFLN
jgi:hypothetical protein